LAPKSICDNFVQTLDDSSQLFGGRPSQSTFDALDRQRSNLAHDRFGNPHAAISIASGNPARWGWLVNATAITVPDHSLKTS
jgi:hypothetical protein